MDTHSCWMRTHDQNTRLRRQAMRGNVRAFVEIIRPMGPVLHGVIRQALGEQALDALQTTVREAFSRREERSAAVPIPMWLLRRAVAMTEAWAGAGNTKRQSAENEDTPASPPQLPAAYFPHGESFGGSPVAGPVARALERMPERARMLLYLRHVPALLVQDLSRVFGRTPHQISAALFHALETVRRFRDRAAGRTPDPDELPDASESPFCTEVRERVALIKDGDIDEAGIEPHRAHFRSCPTCLQYAVYRTEVKRELTGFYRAEQVTDGELDLVLGDALLPRASFPRE